MALVLDGSSLTCAQIVDAARGPVHVRLTADARERIEASARVAREQAARRPVYGRTTGVGANSGVPLPPVAGTGDGQDEARAQALLRSHATSTGPLRSTERVRAMLVVRINQLAAGGSGAGAALVDALVDLAAGPTLPAVREHAGIGTADLAALARIGVAVGAVAAVDAGDALPLISSNAAVIADAALLRHDLGTTVHAAIATAALSVVALRGNGEAWSAAAERATPFPGAVRVARALRTLTVGAPEPARLQDPFALRVLPQSLGPVLDALTRLQDVVETMANVAAENPLCGPDGVVHHGGFHASYLAQALDAVTLSIARAATGSVRRLAMMLDPQYTGLPAFLGDGTPGANGAMMLEYLAADAAAELDRLATPSGRGGVSISRGIEDDASMAPLAARSASQAGERLGTVLACELLAARRASGPLRGPHDAFTVPSPLAAADPLLAVLDGDPADRDLSDDLDAARTLLPALARLPALAAPPR